MQLKTEVGEVTVEPVRGSRAFEILGFDIMIDDELRPWLLEVNVSPDVSHSTPVTASLAKAATRDLLALVLDEGVPDGSPFEAGGDQALPPTRFSPEVRAGVPTQVSERAFLPSEASCGR